MHSKQLEFQSASSSLKKHRGIKLIAHISKLLGILFFMSLALGSATSQQNQQASVNRLQAKCASFGFRYGTDAMANCVSQQYAAEVAAEPGNTANSNAQMQRGLDLLSGRCQLGAPCR